MWTKCKGRGWRWGKGGGGCTDHLVGSPEGDDLDVSVLVGNGVAVPQPVKVMHYSTAHHTANGRLDFADA